jgi:hypothetical protein
MKMLPTMLSNFIIQYSLAGSTAKPAAMNPPKAARIAAASGIEHKKMMHHTQPACKKQSTA